eukprot:TRINITY_DN6913_c0_g1_i2.p1 TRINITY_DN6913_c0_g1~~TRINITY_DN6913_c0_g1_i2.p1  ORF type:complete len:218 (+),score=5.74 TRINITY_DN6913_c0_g1_i2:81-734(+)
MGTEWCRYKLESCHDLITGKNPESFRIKKSTSKKTKKQLPAVSNVNRTDESYRQKRIRSRKNEETESCYINRIPTVLLDHIFLFVDLSTLCICDQVCRYWQSFLPASFFKSRFDELFTSPWNGRQPLTKKYIFETFRDWQALDHTNSRALRWACSNGHPNALLYLLKRKDWDTADYPEYGEILSMLGSRWCNRKVAHILLDAMEPEKQALVNTCTNI